jgi:hypothetical protein
MVSSASGIFAVAGRNVVSRAENKRPVLPHLLVEIRGRELTAWLRKRGDRLRADRGSGAMCAIERDHQDLLGAYGLESHLRDGIYSCNSHTSFDEVCGCWRQEGCSPCGISAEGPR